MFQRILVPLDGSIPAEAALPAAARLARASEGSIVLFQAVSIPPKYATYLYSESLAQTPFFAQQFLDAEQAKASAYLSSVAEAEPLKGIRTETHIVLGAAASSILDIVREQQVDVIVLCRHGASGLQRWLLGSVAQKVVRHSCVPVLLVHEDASFPTKPYPDASRPLRSLLGLVALDGSVLAEATLVPAAWLMAALAAPARGSLLLTKVVKLPEKDTPWQEQARDEAKTYLSRLTQRLSARSSPIADLDLTISWSVAVGEDVADTLISLAERGKDAEGMKEGGGCEVIAMATHGRGGLQRWVMGSVTERVLSATTLPLLIVRPEEVHTTPDANNNGVPVYGGA